jgi:hypothetical protein
MRGGQKSEVGDQRSEVRSQRSEVSDPEGPLRGADDFAKGWRVVARL